MMNKTDIVLVKPGSQKQLYGSLSDFRLTGIEPPLWGAILAGFLRVQGYSVALYDLEAQTGIRGNRREGLGCEARYSGYQYFLYGHSFFINWFLLKTAGILK
jgi:hypothetical protein